MSTTSAEWSDADTGSPLAPAALDVLLSRRFNNEQGGAADGDAWRPVVDAPLHTDADGWAYAPQLSGPWTAQQWANSNFRRRRWTSATTAATSQQQKFEEPATMVMPSSNVVANDAATTTIIAAAEGQQPRTSTNCAGGGGVLLFSTYENQRWFMMKGFSEARLPTDRYLWSDDTGTEERRKESIDATLPHGFEWQGGWTVFRDHPAATDAEGWTYATDFSTTYHAAKFGAAFVRRRRWDRVAVKTHVSSTSPQASTNSNAALIGMNGDGREVAEVMSAVPISRTTLRALLGSEATSTPPAADVAAHDDGGAAANGGSDVLVYSYENERWHITKGFSDVLLPTDRWHWSDVTGKEERQLRRLDEAALPQGYAWRAAWSVYVDHPATTDVDGWTYAMDFPATYHAAPFATAFVRRRCWQRRAAAVSSTITASAPGNAAPVRPNGSAARDDSAGMATPQSDGDVSRNDGSRAAEKGDNCEGNARQPGSEPIKNSSVASSAGHTGADTSAHGRPLPCAVDGNE